MAEPLGPLDGSAVEAAHGVPLRAERAHRQGGGLAEAEEGLLSEGGDSVGGGRGSGKG